MFSNRARTPTATKAATFTAAVAEAEAGGLAWRRATKILKINFDQNNKHSQTHIETICGRRRTWIFGDLVRVCVCVEIEIDVRKLIPWSTLVAPSTTRLVECLAINSMDAFGNFNLF